MKRQQKKKFILVPAEDYLYDMSSDEEIAQEPKRKINKKRSTKKKWDDEAVAEYYEDSDRSANLGSKMKYFLSLAMIVAGLYALTHPEIKIGDTEIGSIMPQSMKSMINEGKTYLKSKFINDDNEDGEEELIDKYEKDDDNNNNNNDNNDNSNSNSNNNISNTTNDIVKDKSE